MNDSFYQKYADLILFGALGIRENDVLSINTEEEDYAFARLIAEKAKAVTGNGSYIQLLKDGKVREEFDILSSFPLKKKPTLFLYLSYYREKEEADTARIYEARELQKFSLLSDPLGNPMPSLPFVTCLLPSPGWDERIRENDEEKTSRELLESVLGLDSPDFLEENMRRHENLLYKTKILNSMKLRSGRITDDSGTDLTFSFLPTSEFSSSFTRTTLGRFFSPYIFSCDIFRLIDPDSLSGWLNISKPVVIWGKTIRNLSLHFEKGKVNEVRGSRQSEELFSLYSRQDENATRASMLTLSEIEHPLFGEEVTHIPEFDRMRTVSITIGGPKGEAVNEESLPKTVDSIVSLSLPIGSENLLLECLDENDEEITVFSDGYINEEF